jgi:hypothetical protein
MRIILFCITGISILITIYYFIKLYLKCEQELINEPHHYKSGIVYNERNDCISATSTPVFYNKKTSFFGNMKIKD